MSQVNTNRKNIFVKRGSEGHVQGLIQKILYQHKNNIFVIFSKICHYKDEQKKYFTMTILFWDGLDGRDGIDKTGESKASRAPVCKRFF